MSDIKRKKELEKLKDEAVWLVKYFSKNALAVCDRRKAQEFVSRLPPIKDGEKEKVFFDEDYE